eukprot:scaffold5383_cov222-Amphora_coffeaeformis.AAC.10
MGRLVPDTDRLIELVFGTAMYLYEQDGIKPTYSQAVEKVRFVLSTNVKNDILKAYQSVIKDSASATPVTSATSIEVGHHSMVGDSNTMMGDHSTLLDRNQVSTLIQGSATFYN